jgi:hypothetical protein
VGEPYRDIDAEVGWVAIGIVDCGGGSKMGGEFEVFDSSIT